MVGAGGAVDAGADVDGGVPRVVGGDVATALAGTASRGVDVAVAAVAGDGEVGALVGSAGGAVAG